MLDPVLNNPGLNNGRSACSDLWPLCYHLLWNWRTPFQASILARHDLNSLRHIQALQDLNCACRQQQRKRICADCVASIHGWLWLAVNDMTVTACPSVLPVTYTPMNYTAAGVQQIQCGKQPYNQPWTMPCTYCSRLLKVSMHSDGAAIQQRELEIIC